MSIISQDELNLGGIFILVLPPDSGCLKAGQYGDMALSSRTHL